MRRTELRPDRDGHYRRNIGYLEREGGRVTQPKISLGTAKRAAKDRLAKIAAIWQRIEADAAKTGRRPFWDVISLDVAKAIGKGETEYPVERLDDRPIVYARQVEMLAHLFPEILIRPKDEALYREGKGKTLEACAEIEEAKRDFLSIGAKLENQFLSPIGAEGSHLDLTSQTLHEAFDAYVEYIGKDKFDTSERAVNDTGKTKQSMIKQLKTYLNDQSLQSLNDSDAVDELYGILRRRPITHRYKKPMAKKTACNLIGELSQFFDWLHRSPRWEWREPLDYHKINYRPLDLESDDEAETEDIPTYSRMELRTLFEYATPLERLLLLLAINCAYGADQIGRLRIGEVQERKGVYYIKRVRKKKKVKGIHRLFAVTVQGIQWATQGREDQGKAHVLLNGNGNPLWRKTKGGNRSKDIPNAWYRLLDRVQKDHPGFPRHGFNTLRDTSADMVRRIAGGEVASMHLTHRHQSRDRNLRRYTNPPRSNLFKAQRILERKLSKAFVMDDSLWENRDHQYVTQGQIEKMRTMANDGIPVAQIANGTGVARTTVYRWLGNTAH